MSWILTDDQNYKDIANAIREKTGSEETYTPNQMADAINKIEQIDSDKFVPIESAIKVSGTGTKLVSLSPTVEWKMQGLKVYGRSTQQTATGAQLFDESLYGELQINMIKYIPIEVGDGTFTLSSNIPEETAANLFLLSGNVQNGASTTINGVNVKTPRTVISTNGYITIGARGGTSESSATPENYKTMLNAGSTALSWEPYTGGMSSPSPEYPQEIVSAGQSGQIDVTIRRGNFMPLSQESKTIVYNGITMNYDASTGVFSFSGKATNDAWFSLYWVIDAPSTGNDNGDPVGDKGLYLAVDTPLPTGVHISCSPSPSVPITAGGTHCTLQAPIRRVYMLINSGVSISYSFRLGVFATPNAKWEPYSSESQQLLIPTPNGLPGIPVKSGGNWIDENGQQWICDIVDLKAGVWTHNVTFSQIDPERIYSIDSSRQVNSEYYGIDYRGLRDELTGNMVNGMLYDIGSFVGVNSDINGAELSFAPGNGILNFGVEKSTIPDGTIESVKSYFSEHPFNFWFAIKEPYSTSLTSDELAVYKVLQSYSGTTNVLVPDCGIEASAIANANEYIDQKISNAITQAITLSQGG